MFCGLVETPLGLRVLDLTNNHDEDLYPKLSIGRGSPDMYVDSSLQRWEHEITVSLLEMPLYLVLEEM